MGFRGSGFRGAFGHSEKRFGGESAQGGTVWTHDQEDPGGQHSYDVYQVDKWCYESATFKSRMWLSLDFDEIGGGLNYSMDNTLLHCLGEFHEIGGATSAHS